MTMTITRASFRCTILAVCGLIAGSVSAGAQDHPVWVGELRLMALDPANANGIDALHHAGWLEADGRLLKRDDFPELFAGIGRAWTKRKIAAERFAVPNLIDRNSPISSDNPYGVLGPGDLVTSGLPVPRPATPRYFIYVGKDVSASLVAVATTGIATHAEAAVMARR
jgi:hypothetical protein